MQGELLLNNITIWYAHTIFMCLLTQTSKKKVLSHWLFSLWIRFSSNSTPEVCCKKLAEQMKKKKKKVEKAEEYV